MKSSIEVTPRAHWLSAAFIYLVTRPVILIDGTKHGARWSKPSTILVDPGTHSVAVGIRYRGTSSVLGTDGRSIEVGEGKTVTVKAQNGALNSDPFALTLEG